MLDFNLTIEILRAAHMRRETDRSNLSLDTMFVAQNRNVNEPDTSNSRKNDLLENRNNTRTLFVLQEFEESKCYIQTDNMKNFLFLIKGHKHSFH